MSDAAWTLQHAVYARLTADAELLGRVYDAPPQAVPFPFVTLEQNRVADFSTGTERGDEHTLTVHVWSRLPSRAEVYALSARIREALDDAPLLLSGRRLVSLRHLFSDTARDPDGETHHAVLRFRAVTEPN